MKILKLTSENVKRLSVVEIVPGEGGLITIGGKNGAGKSSVLDSIAYVLGGEKLIPSSPIRAGEAEARVTADLGDFVVTRRFYREAVTCECGHPVAGHSKESQQCQQQVDPDGDLCDCKNIRKIWGDTKSTLTVTNKDGAKYPSPQSMLDKLYGKLSFDPLAFSKETPAKQNEILRRLCALDFTVLDGQRKTAFERRAMNKKALAVAVAQLEQTQRYPNAPPAEVSLDDVSKELSRATELSTLANEAVDSVSKCRDRSTTLRTQCQHQEDSILALRKELQEAEDELRTMQAQLSHNDGDLAAKMDVEASARAAVPDFTQLNAKMREIEETNKQVRANQAYGKQQDAVKRFEVMVEEDTAAIAHTDHVKQAALAEAQFPVPGLGLSDDGVVFEGLPLEQVSSSVQLRVSIAIGLALNPTLKVLLIRNGNLLDDDSLQLVAEQSAAAGAQVWLEYVTASAEGVSVMLEDGHLAQ